MEIYFLLYVVTALIGALIAYYFFFTQNRFEKHGIPTPKRLSYLSNSIRLLMRSLSMVDNIESLYSINKDAKYIGFYDFHWPIIMLQDLELIKSVTVKNFDHFVDHRSFIDPELEPLFGKNLFSLRGDKWREIRTLLSPAFTSSKMKAMFILMSQCAENFASLLVEKSKGKPIEINSKDVLTFYTNDTIATCAFGVAVDSMKDPNNEFYVLGKKATNFSGVNMLKFMMSRISPKLSKFIGLKMISRDVEDFFYQLIRDTIAMRDEKNIVRPDMLQLMMATRGKGSESKNPELSIESMTSQAFIFFFGGFDSTSTLMCFVFHEIAGNLEMQKKLQDEIDEVFEKSDGNPTYEAVNNMEYLDAIINESLRMYPIGLMLDRLCTKRFELPPAVPGGKPYVIEPGNNIWIPIWSIHRNPEYFPEPNKFLPERFLEGGKETFNSSAYMPFGLGPRMCIGNRFALLETKVLLIHFFRMCNAKIAKKMKIPLKISAKTLNLMAEGGFWLEIEPRK
ncbi:cytochrome P450 9e2-like [Chelonus insularis]|uniref:cytochrome P450 9e2-like n=1 Tax=Chelonus insularis TaxID=460826 RepID=UPI00158ABB7F|nr:cytochrome P450 9e2-like [Chelonus insularis]